MNKNENIPDKFDCVEMKHKAARIINRKLSKMTREEELSYWNSKIKPSRLRHPKNRKLSNA